MFVRTVDFDSACAFIDGFNTAVAGSLLLGFREWLVMRKSFGSNLAWSELVNQQCAPNERNDDSARLRSLFALLEQFYVERDGPAGLRGVFVRYEMWLR